MSSQNLSNNEKEYLVKFTTKVIVSDHEIDMVRKSNKGILSNGFFAKDCNIGQALAYNKAREKVDKQSSEVKTSINIIESSDLQLNL